MIISKKLPKYLNVLCRESGENKVEFLEMMLSKAISAFLVPSHREMMFKHILNDFYLAVSQENQNYHSSPHIITSNTVDAKQRELECYFNIL